MAKKEVKSRKKLPTWAWILIILGVLIVIATTFFTQYLKYEGCRDGGINSLSVSPDDQKIVYHKCEGSSFFYKKSLIVISNVEGSNTELLLSSQRRGIYTKPIFSPDQSKILLIYNGQLEDWGIAHQDLIYELDLKTKELKQIDFLKDGVGMIVNIVYSPDGSKIYFKDSKFYDSQGYHSEVPYEDLYSIDSTGENLQRLTYFARLGSGLSISPDGRRLYSDHYYFDLDKVELFDLKDALKNSTEFSNKTFWATTNNPLSEVSQDFKMIWIGGFGEYRGDESIIYGLYLIDLKNNTANEISSTLGYISWPRFIGEDKLVFIKGYGSNNEVWELNMDTMNLTKISLLPPTNYRYD